MSEARTMSNSPAFRATTAMISFRGVAEGRVKQSADGITRP